MPVSDTLPEIQLLLAVPFESPGDFAAALPREVELAEGALVMPDGRRYGWSARPQDGEFARVVIDGAGRPPTPAEQQAMHAAPVLLEVYGPGGSADAAAGMLEVGAMLCDAGASGLLVYNSGLGHGATDWLALAEDAAGPEGGGPHWAYVATTRSRDLSKMGVDGPGLFTTGMHCLGHRDVAMPSCGDDETDWFMLNNFCGYLEHSGRVPVDGDVLTALQPPEDAEGLDELEQAVVPLQRVRYAPCAHLPEGSPMHNPYGMYLLLPLDPDDPESMAYRPAGNGG